MSRKSRDFEFDVCLSFAGENRKVAEKIARACKREKLTVFFDTDHRLALWGKDLFKHLFEVYSKKAEFCVILFSKEYIKKNWTNHELRAAQLRTLADRREYVLPVKIAGGAIPDEFASVAYLDLATSSPRDLALGVALKKGERAWEKGWVPEKDLISALNHEFANDALVNYFRDAVSSEKDRTRALAKALCSIIYLCQDDADGAVAAYFSYLLTLFPALGRYFDARQEFAIVQRGGKMKRWLTAGARCTLLLRSATLVKQARQNRALKRKRELSAHERMLLAAAFKRARKKKRR